MKSTAGYAISMPGKVRIISGQWRGRKLDVPDVSGLRPSGDRLREVLFNWLQGRVAGRRCLDLFAGTGVLGLEAASRGAEQVTLVEKSARLCHALDAIRQGWPGGECLQVVNEDVLCFLDRSVDSRAPPVFDRVFLDPPFDAGLHAAVLQRLLTNEWLADQALVYVESRASRHDALNISDDWQVLREKTIGEVQMHLLSPSEQHSQF